VAPAAAPLPGPAVTISGGTANVAAGTGRGDVWLVHFDPRARAVAIKAGENGGRTLSHRNIVTGLTRLGRWTGAAAAFALPASPAGQRTAVLVQSGPGGAIVAAARG